ncbi:Leishmanolysin-like peptidase [Phytophthora citrophthora]|uniref:Leishmanolysin-like peptidase n=1 Tax=Phytophthora citrophthora TaxID=4793 RepID=A0AAD9G0P8_9STRA|nr:Leishmanolysin-like peptidase [Phytophthora citrophthora]
MNKALPGRSHSNDKSTIVSATSYLLVHTSGGKLHSRFARPQIYYGKTTCTSYGCVNDPCEVSPAGPGVPNTDFLIYVRAESTSGCSSGSTLAYASACQQDQYDRPTFGMVNFCPNKLSTSSSDFERQVSTALHEFSHALGFSSRLFPLMRNEDGTPRTPRDSDGDPHIYTSGICPNGKEIEYYVEPSNSTIQFSTERDHVVAKMVTPRVRAYVQQHFNCSTLEGAEMESQDGGCIGSHWEERLFESEYMTAVDSYHNVFSALTLAFFEDSGWYRVNASTSEMLHFGLNKGCSFVTEKCVDPVTEMAVAADHFCTSIDTQGCSVDARSRSTCSLSSKSQNIPAEYQYFLGSPSKGGINTFADFCLINVGYSGGDCSISTNLLKLGATSINAYGESYCPTCKCTRTSLRSGDSTGWGINPPRQSGCYSINNKKKRVRSAASSSTALQRRKRAAIETLREEVASLEGHLAQLTTAGGHSYASAVTEDDEHLSEWNRRALLQYQKRRQSEQENRHLKKMLLQQSKISRQLRGILHGRNVFAGMDFVRTFESPICEGSYFTTNHSAMLLGGLGHEVDSVYRNFHRIYRPHESTRSQLIYNEKHDANVINFSMKTPLDWPMRSVFKNVWELLEKSSDRSRKPNTLEAKINVTLPLLDHSSSQFHQLHLVRKFEEKDRIVIVCSDLIQMTSRKIRLRSVGQAVFSPSEMDSSSGCVLEMFLKLCVEPSNTEEDSSDDIRHGQEVVLGAFGRHVRKFWQNEQNRLVDVTHRLLDGEEESLNQDLYQSIRITPYYDNASFNNLTSDIRDTVDKVMQEAIQRTSKALQVVPVRGNLFAQRFCPAKFSTSPPVCQSIAEEEFCLEMTMPDDHFAPIRYCDQCTSNDCADDICVESPAGQGVPDTDFLIYVKAEDTANCLSDGTLAYASTCQQDQFDRPTFGMVNFCPGKIDTADFAFESLVSTALHELSHALGFSSRFFPLMRYDDGTPRTERDEIGNPPIFSAGICPNGKEIEYYVEPSNSTIQFSTERDHVVAKMVTPRVRAYVQQHFNCSTLEGAEMESQDGGCIGSHWEERLFESEYMTAVDSYHNVFSALTLAFFEDSGWYRVNASTSEMLHFGLNKGCSFVTEKCVDPVTEMAVAADHFCTSIDTQGCSVDARSRSTCSLSSKSQNIPAEYQYFLGSPSKGGINTFADFCPINVGYSGGDCSISTNLLNLGNSSVNALGETYCSTCKCTTTSLRSDDSSLWSIIPARQTGCYLMKCIRNSRKSVSSLIVKLTVQRSQTQDTVTLTCSKKGVEFSVPGFSGVITCPDPLVVCGNDDPSQVEIVTESGGTGSSASGTFLDEMAAFLNKTDAPRTLVEDNNTNTDLLDDRVIEDDGSNTTDSGDQDRSFSTNTQVSKHLTRRQKEILRKKKYERRLKNERETLRSLVGELTAKLTQLKQGNTSTQDDTSAASAATWQALAIVHRDQRHQAEKEKHRLEAAIDEQATYLATLRALLPKHIYDWVAITAITRAALLSSRQANMQANHVLFSEHLRQVFVAYTQVDEQFGRFESLPDGMTSSLHRLETDGLQRYKHFHKITFPFSLKQTSEAWWNLTNLNQWVQDGDGYTDLADPNDAVILRVRVVRTLSSGMTVSILQRYILHRFVEENRSVFLWRTYSEGEGEFAGIHVEETGWARLQPSTDGESTDVAVRVHQIPMITLNRSGSQVETFFDVMQSLQMESAQLVTTLLSRKLLQESLETIDLAPEMEPSDVAFLSEVSAFLDTSDLCLTDSNVVSTKASVQATRQQKQALRKKRYELRLKNEREVLQRLKVELTSRLTRLQCEYKNKANRSNTDAATSNSPWRNLVLLERQQLLQLKEEQEKLVSAVTMQASYINTLRGMAPDELLQAVASQQETFVAVASSMQVNHQSNHVRFAQQLSQVVAAHDQAGNIFSDFDVFNIPTGMTSGMCLPKSGGAAFYQHFNRFTQPFRLDQTQNSWWKLASLEDVIKDREDYSDLADPRETTILRLRLVRTLVTGATVSIIQRYIFRRVVEENRAVFTWKTLSEGEGIFTGMYLEETGWASLQEPKEEEITVVGVCVQQTPMRFGELKPPSTDNQTFCELLRNMLNENAHVITAALSKMLIDETLAGMMTLDAVSVEKSGPKAKHNEAKGCSFPDGLLVSEFAQLLYMDNQLGASVVKNEDLPPKPTTRAEREVIRKRKYHQRLRNERESLRQTVNELSLQLQQLKQKPTGINWEDFALQQKLQLQKVEMEHKKLFAATKMQALYIGKLCEQLPDRNVANLLIRATANRAVPRPVNPYFDYANYCALAQTVNACYVKVDDVMREFTLNSMRDGVTSSMHYCEESGEVEYFQHLNQFTEPYSYKQTRGTWWKLAKLLHRQHDRQDLDGLGSPNDTVALRFRLVRTLRHGETVSVLQRYVHQRFMEDSRTIFVWKTQSEGEDVFKGMKCEETGWVCLQPSMEDDSTLVRVCVRQAPLHVGSCISLEETAREFDDVLQSSVREDMNAAGRNIGSVMATDFDFLDEVAAFLDPDTLPPVTTPRGDDNVGALSESTIAASYTGQKKTKLHEEPTDNRRKRYRDRIKNERQELKRMERELTQRLQGIIDFRQGANTCARTDLSTSNSFWQDLAIQQKQHLISSEEEQKRLVAATIFATYDVFYLKILPSIPVLRSNTVQPLNNLKWLRLKSSDASLYEEYLKEVNDSYARVDQVLADCEMDAMSIGGTSSLRRLSAGGGVEYIQYVHKILQPVSFKNPCRNMWKAAKLPHRQIDREVNEDVSDLGNTVAYRFRLKKTLATGSTLSILRRDLSRQFIENERTVIVGLDTDETTWVSIRPYSDGLKSCALMEICSQQIPAPFRSTNTHDSTVKAFKEMTQQAVHEDERESIRFLEKMLLGILRNELTEFLTLEAFAGRKSLEDGLLQSSVVVEAAKSLLPTDASSDDTDDSLKTERYSTRKSNRRSETPDMRRQKYRMRAKNERDGLRREAKELSTRIRDMISAREGRNTTARTDLVLSKTFWREVAIHQREQRFLVEAEHKHLSAIVNAQSRALSLATHTPRCGYGGFKHDDDLKWLRLKSSVSSLYTTHLQDVDKCYAQVDQIFQDTTRESSESRELPYKYKPNGDIEYFQQRDRALLPSSFENSSRVMWELVLWPHRQIDREVYDVSTAKNVKQWKTMSIMKHLVCRRFIESDRVVIVWRIFSEGEGDFSGLDVDETSWASIRPVNDGSQFKTSMEFYGRQIPVPYLTANANNPIGKAFLDMMQDTKKEKMSTRTRAEAKRLRFSRAGDDVHDSDHSELLYSALTAGALWFLGMKDMVQLLGTCRTLRHDKTLNVMALSNSSVGVHLMHGCSGDWMDLSLQKQQDSSLQAGEESIFWSGCSEHNHVSRKKQVNRLLLEDTVPLDFSRGQAAQMLSLIGRMEKRLKPFYSRAYVATPFGEFIRARPVVVPLPARTDKDPSKLWTMEDARVALNSMWDRFGDDFTASTSEYVHVSELGMHWENTIVAKRDAKKKCSFCDAAKKAVREYRREAKSLMDEFSRVLKARQVEWRAEGLDDDEIHECRSLLKADMFLEDSYPDPNAAESTQDDILAHICENDKFPLILFEGMAHGLERKNDDIFNALALECQDLCEEFYQPLEQNLAAAVAFSGQRVHRSWMDTGEEAAIIRRELIAGLSTSGFLVGVIMTLVVKCSFLVLTLLNGLVSGQNSEGIDGITTPPSGCQLCANSRDCSRAFRDGPGQYCGIWMDQYCGIWMDRLSHELPCCCMLNAVCNVSPADYVCTCAYVGAMPPHQSESDLMNKVLWLWWILDIIVVMAACGACLFGLVKQLMHQSDEIMTSDLDFLDEVSAFLAQETIAGCESLEDELHQRPGDGGAAPDSLSDDADEGQKSERYPTRKSNRRSNTTDTRRQKYRMRAKNERDGLRREAKELSTRIHDMVSTREGRNTTARTDLVLSKTFWREVAIHQREQRLLVEAEYSRLSALVNAQGMYIESLGVRQGTFESALTLATPKRYGTFKHQVDDHKWLRLKSSVCSLYSTYLQEVDNCYAQVDEIFQEIGMESFPIGSPDSSYIYKTNGDVEYFQHRNRLLLPFEFVHSSRVMWELVPLPHRQIDRQVYHGVSDPENTVGFQFRLQKTSSRGKIMSIMKHLVCRRFVESDRVVLVWRVFSEGEGDFSGLDVDENSWACIRPVNDRSQNKTLMEFHSRQTPVPYLIANASNPIVKDFQEMMQDAVTQDEQEVTRLLGKHLLECFLAKSDLGQSKQTKLMSINALNMVALHFRRRLHLYVRFKYAEEGKLELSYNQTKKLVDSCYRVKSVPENDDDGHPTGKMTFQKHRSEILRKVFNVVQFETRSRKFADELKTNGYGVSITMIRPRKVKTPEAIAEKDTFDKELFKLGPIMASDLEFLDEVSAFLALETFAGDKSLDDERPVDGEAASAYFLQADSLSDDTDESQKSKRYPTRKSSRRGDTGDNRRQKYRMRLKSEREQLRRTVDELSTQVKGLIDAQKGKETTARTDLVLAKTFWRKVAIHQREQRLLVEEEHKRLKAIVNAQSMYLESLGVRQDSSALTLLTSEAQGGCLTVAHDQINDLRWLRLKSSVSSLYAMYLQDVDKCYAQVDQIFQGVAMESLPIGFIDSSYRYKPNGDVDYFQHRKRFLQPFSFKDSSRVMWELVPLPHRQIDRQVYHGVSDPENTVGFQFRLQKTSSRGKIMSIMKHVVCRRFIESDRVVIVWKIFSEGEGDFSGLDVDETCWASIRPGNDGSQNKTLLEFHSRQMPVPYLIANASNSVVKDFRDMMQDAVTQDEQEVVSLLGKRLLEYSVATAGLELPEQTLCL